MKKKKAILKNVMSKSAYVRENLCWILACLYPWSLIVLNAFSGLSTKNVLRVVLGTIIAVYINLVVLTWKRGRNHLSVAQNILITTASLIFFIYEEDYKLFFNIMGICFAVLTVPIVCYILFRKINDEDNCERIRESRWIRVNYIFRKNLSYTAGIIVILSMMSWGWNTYTRSQNEKQEAFNEAFTQVLHQVVNPLTEKLDFDSYVFRKMPIISKLSQNEWKDLSLEEKKKVGEAIISTEMKRYGISGFVELKFEALEENVAGTYVGMERCILIDTEYVSECEGYDYLSTLLHEMAHFYQHSLLTLYTSISNEQQQMLIFRDVRIYAAELADYKDGLESSYEEYSEQFLEIHADEVAEEQSKYYIEELEEYLFDEEKQSLDIYISSI